jgi:hypothetical protein
MKSEVKKLRRIIMKTPAKPEPKSKVDVRLLRLKADKIMKEVTDHIDDELQRFQSELQTIRVFLRVENGSTDE